MRTSYARKHCQSSSADIPATYVREYATYREAETLQLAIELVLSTVKYLQRAHACPCTLYIPVPTCAYVRTPRSAARRFGARVVVRTRYTYKYACDAYVVHAWDTRATRVGHARDTRATRARHAWDTRALVKLPLGGTVHVQCVITLYASSCCVAFGFATCTLYMYMYMYIWWFHYPGLLLHTELMVSLLFGPSQLSCLGSSVGRALCLQYRVSWVRVPAHFS